MSLEDRKRPVSYSPLGAWLAIGAGIGAAIGPATWQVGVWVGVGAGVGIALGAAFTLKR